MTPDQLMRICADKPPSFRSRVMRALREADRAGTPITSACWEANATSAMKLALFAGPSAFRRLRC